MNLLNRDVQQIIFESLELPEKYNYYLYCIKNKSLHELPFINKYFKSLHQLSRHEWTNLLIDYPDLNENILVEYKDIIDWYIVCLYQNISEDFMNKWITYINWAPISLHRELSDDFIIKHQSRLNWSYLSNSGKLSENIIRRFEHRIDWELLIVSNYSISFLQEYKDKINWTENTFDNMKIYETFEEYIDWERLSYHEPLTEDFMKRFQDKLHWNFISSHQKLSKRFINEFKGRLNMENVNRFNRRSEAPSPRSLTPPLMPMPPPLIRQRRYRRLRRRRNAISISRVPIPRFFE